MGLLSVDMKVCARCAAAHSLELEINWNIAFDRNGKTVSFELFVYYSPVETMLSFHHYHYPINNFI